MNMSFRKAIYHGVCASVALAVAAYAMMPVSAATADALRYRGGQVNCVSGGCHDEDTHCIGNASCSRAAATACLSGENDRNHLKCGPDSGLCSNEGCGGVDATCGGT
jgi:hypothetical protein